MPRKSNKSNSNKNKSNSSKKNKQNSAVQQYYGKISSLGGSQKQTQEEYKELLEQNQKILDLVTNYYGGLPLDLKLFGSYDFDDEKKINDTEFEKVPITVQELKDKVIGPYAMYSRAGHRLVAPMDQLYHVVAIEIAIRRIIHGTLDFPDTLFEGDLKNLEPDVLSQKRKYYLNVLLNVVYDILVEQKMPYVLPQQKQRDQYLKGRKEALRTANIDRLPPNDPLRRIKELEYLLQLEIHRQQDPNSGIPSHPNPDIHQQLIDTLQSIKNTNIPLVQKANQMLPTFIELMNKIQVYDEKNNQNSSCPPGFGNGTRGFGPKGIDLINFNFDMTNPQNQANVENLIQDTLNNMGENILENDETNDQIESYFDRTIQKGSGAGAGEFKLVKWEKSPFINKKNKLLEADFNNVLSDALQRTQIHTASQKGKRERIGNRIWTLADQPKDLLVVQSYQQYGTLIPGITTLMPVYDDGRTEDHTGYSANLIILIDLSGSMGGIMKLALETILSAAMIAKHEGGNVSCIGFESVGYEIMPPSTDIDILIDRIGKLRPRGGTTISAALDCCLQHILLMNKANVLLVTDADIFDWMSPKAKNYWELLKDHILSFHVYQIASILSSNGQQMLKQLQDNYPEAKFFGIDPNESRSFSANALHELFP